MKYQFTVDFDQEADVWFVRETTLPGLRTEADTLDELVAKLRTVVPDLLAAIRGSELASDADIPFDVILHTKTQAHQPAA
jgi:Domain of unknown function (DUF1902)